MPPLPTEDVPAYSHRHMWLVVKYETTLKGRTREVLGCRKCKAQKRRYVKVPKHGR
jgi:hypothetical protein